MSRDSQEFEKIAAFVVNVGLGLSAKIREVFRTEVYPDMQRALLRPSWLSQWPGLRKTMERRWEQEAQRIVVGRLRELELVAAGQREMDGKLGLPQIIFPAEWDDLNVDQKTGSASRDGVSYQAIRVARVEHLTQGQRENIRRAIFESGLRTNVALECEEKAGRHGGRHLLCVGMIEEMKRRALAGKLSPTLAGEARALRKIRSRHPDITSGRVALPSEGAVENHIRKPYNKLKDDPAARLP